MEFMSALTQMLSGRGWDDNPYEVEKIEVGAPGFHGVDDFGGAVVVVQHDQFEDAGVGIESLNAAVRKGES